MSTVYHLGGYKPQMPNGNRAEEIDLDANTITRWDASGKVIEQRPLTVDEAAKLADPQPIQNRMTIESRARAALATNKTFLAIATPTNAQIAAQVTRLTRQSSTVIRLLLDALDDTSDS